MSPAQFGGRELTEDSSRPNKMLQWACMATRDTEDQLLSWFTSARSHCQETQDAP